MRLDEIARRASEQVRTASNDMPLLPIEQVGAARRRARLLTAAGLALVAFVAGALTLLPGPPNTPTATDPTTTETTDGSPGEVRTAAVFTLDDLTVGEERTDQPFLLPWGEGEGQAGRGSGNRGPCCLAIGPDGAVLVLDQANHRVTQVDDTGARTLFSLGDAEAVALTAGLDRVWVLTETTSSRELIAFGSDGVEAGRWTIDLGGEDPQLAISPDRVWIGVTGTLPAEAGFAPRQWLDVVDAVTLEPVTDQQRSEYRPLPDGRRLGVINSTVTMPDGQQLGVIDSTVSLLGEDGSGVVWLFPPNVTIVSTDPFLDGVLITGTSGEVAEYGLGQAWLVRPDGSIEGFAFPHYLHATGLSQAMTAVSGDRMVTLGSNEEGLLVSTVSLERLGTSPPETLDISDQEYLQMTFSGLLYGADGAVIADLDDFADSVGRVAWDGAAGIVYVTADGTLRHLDPDGNRLVTADLPEGATSRILGTVAGNPTLVGVVAEDALLWIDLVSGERVDAPAGGVDRDPELGPVFTDQGRTVWVDSAGLATAQRGEGGEPLGEYDLPRVVVEDAATGDILTTLVLGTYERPYLRIHDFDGRRLIVSREPHEPANPPLTVFIIDLECGDCTEVIKTTGPHSFTLVGMAQSEGAVVEHSIFAATECATIGPERPQSVGPVFMCGELGFGQVVLRSGVTTAEQAVLAWLEGPTAEEQAAGLQGWDLREYPWFAESLTLRREGSTLIMELARWEPINNLSTSNGFLIFYTTLLATVFSDPTVEAFELSILGESCPVQIGEALLCFPITWDEFASSPTG